MEALLEKSINNNDTIHLIDDLGEDNEYNPSLKYDDFQPNTDEGKYVSEEEYWNDYYEVSDISYEWNNGILEVKPVADFESFNMYDWFLGLIKEYLQTYYEGVLVGLEIGFKLTLGPVTTIRKPDLAIIHKNNPVQMEPSDRSYKGCFDICFEFMSDSNKKAIKNDTVVKKLEYAQFGVREYFLLDRNNNETAFYKLDKNGKYRKIRSDSNGIIRSSVLPNFQFRIKDLYNRPKYIELIDDKVYKHYVLTKYQKAKKIAEKAEKRADKAEKEAVKADKRAEDLRKKVEIEIKKAEMYKQEIQKLKAIIESTK